MALLNRLGIRWKLIGMSALGILLMVVVGAVGIADLANANSTLHGVTSKQDAALAAAHEAQDALASSQRDLMWAILAPDAATRDAQLKALDKDGQQYIDDLKSIRHGLTDKADAALIQAAQSTYEDWTKTLTLIRGQLDHGGTDSAQLLLTGKDTGASADAANDAIDKVAERATQRAAAAVKAANSQGTRAQALMLGLILAGMAAGLTLAFLLARGIVNGVRAVQRVLTSVTERDASALEASLAAMAHYDLSVDVAPVTQPIARYGGDEIGQTAAVANQLLAKLQSTIASYERTRTQLRELVGQIQAGAGAEDTSRAALSGGEAVSRRSDAIDGIARGAQEQARQTAIGSATVEEMAR